MNIRLFPSLIAVSQLELASVISNLECLVDGFHIDIMDDHFVSNIGFSPQLIKEIQEHTKQPLWMHLMVEKPQNWLKRAFLFKKTDLITIHYETLPEGNTHQKLLIDQFKTITPYVGIALKDTTPSTTIMHLVKHLDHVLLMAVKPGFSGQQFLEATRKNIHDIKKIRTEEKSNFRIGIDGGVTFNLFQGYLKKEVDDIVVGSAFFRTSNYVETIMQWESIKKR